jgi:hypothetical protein
MILVAYYSWQACYIGFVQLLIPAGVLFCTISCCFAYMFNRVIDMVARPTEKDILLFSAATQSIFRSLNYMAIA